MSTRLGAALRSVRKTRTCITGRLRAWVVASLCVWLWVALGAEAHAQSGSDSDGGASCVGLIIGLLLPMAFFAWRARSRRNAFRSQAVGAVLDEPAMARLPDKLAIDLAQQFAAIHWLDSDSVPPLQVAEKLIFHTQLKELLVRKLVLHGTAQRSLDWTDMAFLTGTDRRLLVTAGPKRDPQVLLSVPWADVTGCSSSFDYRQRAICFKSGQSLDVELGLPESLLDKHMGQFTSAIETIVAFYREPAPHDSIGEL